MNPPTSTTGQPVDGAAILDQVHACLTKYVILPSTEAMDAVALWIAATHAQPAWAHAARLVIRAPEKRCGKSRLLDVVEATCYAPLITVNASPAAVYRAIGTDDPPTLLVDEADTIFGPAAEANEDLRGLLNAGHQRNRPAIRWDAAAQKVEKIPTFSMAALAGIGAMPDTIEDRAVVIRMRRRAPGEQVAPYRHRRDSPALRALARQLTGWLRANLRNLETAEPAMPVEDRAADTWEPLVAVADLAGGDWPQRARQACEALNAERDGNAVPSDRIRLLTDCRAAFRAINAVDNQGRPAIPSSVLLDKLRTDPEAPWAEYGKAGTGLTAMKLGQLLAEYEIRSANIRFGSAYGQVKGYYQADFTDAWNRYCPAPNTVPQGEASQPSQPSPPSSAPGRVIPLGRLKPSQPTTAPTTAGTA
ncbi:DUF3631 domain-containing protein [Micromonospora echinofusca]|uniref:DUF3631 domain-containing protein n=1 Tax=Micromonospora echinofusca TaxID=47858 RepID=UPI0033D11ADE